MKFDFQYYTTWSNLFFYAAILSNAFVKIPRAILMAALINMITIGIMGNIIFSFNIQGLARVNQLPTSTIRSILLVNLMMHTLPLIISLLIVRHYDLEGSSMLMSLVIISILLGLWVIVPDKKNNVLGAKINDMYGTPSWVYYVLFFIVLAAATRYVGNPIGNIY